MAGRRLENRVSASHKKYNSDFPDWMIDDWKRLQCDACRNGNRSKCTATKNGARAVRTDHNGKDHYYCFLGCLMLHMIENSAPDDIKHFNESQFNADGHYEKLRNDLYDPKISVKRYNKRYG